jgi:hypothetical protein
MVLMDCTIWPVNNLVVEDVVDCAKSLLHQSPNHFMFVLAPQAHAQTTPMARRKHMRLLEDKLLAADLFVTECPLLYALPEAHASDNRPLSQPGYICYSNSYKTNNWHSSGPFRGRTGPHNLIRTKDMTQDDMHRLGPAARADQKGVPCCEAILKDFIDTMQFPPATKVYVIDMLPNRSARDG